MSNDQKAQEQEQYGVLLYYKFTSISNLNDLVSFYESNCNSLGLLGRVRISPHGVNVTVGGKLSSLEEHIAILKLNPVFHGTDFKLASCDHPLNENVARECGFTSLSIRVVKELVTLSSCPLLKPPEISNAGRHLSAVQFHSAIENAGQVLDTDSGTENKGLVLLDARNLYETRIGKFQTPGAETLDPEIRQYSDLPSWIDSNADHLRGKNILMYCTGGIRCEMASAYVRSKGAGFENVFQLYGGIQRYLEQFPDGGFFKGKNFVFDHRISVGSSDTNIMGTCLLCHTSYDDYSPRCRCTHCRMLVLVCQNCRVNGDRYVCELCQKHSEETRSQLLVENKNISFGSDLEPVCQLPEVNGTVPKKKLRILCLHGFRQNASGFKGRTSSLAKKLKNIAELIFIDAPHELPFIYQPINDNKPPLLNCKSKFAWLVTPGFTKTNETDWKSADGAFDPLQYQQQTDGFDTSLAHLKSIFDSKGPFDGILGFSQGAAMAALVCEIIDFRFAVLCSGYPVKLPEFEWPNTIKCPSLHIFGSTLGGDKQIGNLASKELASMFDEGCSVVIEHDSGHIIPTRSPYIEEVKNFLERFR